MLFLPRCSCVSLLLHAPSTSLLLCFGVLVLWCFCMLCHDMVFHYSCDSLFLCALIWHSVSLLLCFIVLACFDVTWCFVIPMFCFAPLLCMKPSIRYLLFLVALLHHCASLLPLPKLILAPPPLFFKFSNLWQGAWGVGTMRLQV
jgi:hypothetical protein